MKGEEEGGCYPWVDASAAAVMLDLSRRMSVCVRLSIFPGRIVSLAGEYKRFARQTREQSTESHQCIWLLEQQMNEPSNC